MTAASHLEVIVEEPSMEAFLRELLPRLLDDRATFEVYPFQCKDELLKRIPQRLQGYRGWLPRDWRILVVVDRDEDDCVQLKNKLEHAATEAGLKSRQAAGGAQTWQVVTRLAIEELEAWYFGEWDAVRACYPRVPPNVPAKENYRDPDAVPGGTWESFERILQRAGYFAGGLRKIEAARILGQAIDAERNRSKSFAAFRDVVREAVGT